MSSGLVPVNYKSGWFYLTFKLDYAVSKEYKS